MRGNRALMLSGRTSARPWKPRWLNLKRSSQKPKKEPCPRETTPSMIFDRFDNSLSITLQLKSSSRLPVITLSNEFVLAPIHTVAAPPVLAIRGRAPAKIVHRAVGLLRRLVLRVIAQGVILLVLDLVCVAVSPHEVESARVWRAVSRPDAPSENA